MTTVLTKKEAARLLGGETEKSRRVRKVRLLPTEHEEQVAVMDWATANSGRWSELKLLHAIPNGGSRAAKIDRKGRRYSPEAQRMVAEGVKSGVPDLDLPVARRGFHGLRIEMKAIDGTVSSEQKWWLRELGEQGYCAIVRNGADAAIAAIKWYLGRSE